ncbi:Crp/Fnr family transcriptional regulator [Thalassoroseus pseudoceratinae]|uniref:Crp/Fnr family transcriptional regulator n=1 Tax=Thalassoroseus pseudoceratinae TaxID=2713176 RepID=UPI00141EB48C|nr:Crp/Fnr family transcriptional regulator [Thalassoroseus pseudoceratinae]
MDEKFWFLKNCDLFRRLTQEQIEQVELRSRAREFQRGEVVYLPSDSSDSIVLLTSGRVKIYHLTADGKEAVIGLIDPGELFGELAVFGNGPREEFAETMEKSTAVLIPSELVHQLMQDHPTVTLGVTKLMGLQRRRVERRLKSLLFRSNRERVIYLLLELAEKYGQPSADGVRLTIRLSHQELANIIGTTRESVTMLLGELQTEGLVKIERRRIILRDLQRLASSIGADTPKIMPTDEVGTRLYRQVRAQSG